MKKNKHIIKMVQPGSIAEELEIEPGDELISINDQKIDDVFDYHYLVNDDYLTVLIRKTNGEEWELEIEKEYEEGKRLDKMPRILITGCPIGGATEKVIRAVEDNGGVVVAFENCNGAKSFDKLVDEENPDVYDALARRYLNIGCSVMTPNPNRLDLLDRLIDEFKVDGVVEMTLQACHTYNVESLAIRKFVNEKKGIPYINVETDYSQADIGQLNTRIAAFIEML